MKRKKKQKQETKLMWLSAGRLYCSENCARLRSSFSRSIPFLLAPATAKCGDLLFQKAQRQP